MSYAHVTIATRDVARTVEFFQETVGWQPVKRPGNLTLQGAWLAVAEGQELHIVLAEEFEPSAFEAEFGRHVAIRFPHAEYDALKTRLSERGAEVMEAHVETPFARFFFREPNGYVFEVVPA